MKQYQGAVFFDIDGTLVDERLEIYQPTPKVRDAILQLKENGYMIGLATGRARCYLPDMGIDFDCYIACNGATCEVDGKEIHNQYIPTENLLEILAFLEKEGFGYDLETSQKCYLQPSFVEAFQEMIELFRITNRECFVPLKDPHHLKVNKVLSFFQQESQLEALRAFCQGKYTVMRNHKTLSADIIQKDMSKAVGIRAAIERFGIPMKNTYAFGDDTNDIVMIGEVGHGVAMTPHVPELESVAEYITCGVDQDGVYHGLKHFGLVD